MWRKGDLLLKLHMISSSSLCKFFVVIITCAYFIHLKIHVPKNSKSCEVYLKFELHKYLKTFLSIKQYNYHFTLCKKHKRDAI